MAGLPAARRILETHFIDDGLGLGIAPRVSRAFKEKLQGRLLYAVHTVRPGERKRAAMLGLDEWVRTPGTDYAKSVDRVSVISAMAEPIDLGPLPEAARRTAVQLVLDFLKSVGGRKHLSHHPVWPAFLNEYLAWRTNRILATVKKQRQRRTSVLPPTLPDVWFLLPEIIDSYDFSEIGDWVSFPVKLR